MNESRRLSTFVLITTLGGMLAVVALPGGCSSSSSSPTPSADSATSDATDDASADSSDVSDTSSTSDASDASDVSPETSSTPCTAVSDCPAPANRCTIAVCASGFCSTSPIAAGQPATKQTDGDCQKIVCDGAGGSSSVGDPSDLPKTTTVCMVASCTGSPLAPSTTPAATGTNCSADGMFPNYVCGDTTDTTVAGTCVECNDNVDCVNGPLDAGSGGCVNHHCQ